MEMSGGDLDGDTFWICLNPKLPFDVNEEPFDYQDQTVEAGKAAQQAEHRPYTIKDVCEFFGEYIEADKSECTCQVRWSESIVLFLVSA